MKTRYFTLVDRDGAAAALYKTEWSRGALVSEKYWDTSSASWQPSKDIFKWNHFGDTEIEEISEISFKNLFQILQLVTTED